MTNNKQQLIVIGNGMAGVRFLEELIALENDFQISVFGSEPHPAYNRILLSPLLSGEQTLDNIITHTEDWYAENHIQFYSGRTIVDVDRGKKIVIDEAGQQYQYDKLLIATGSTPFVPPIEGKDLGGIYTYRTIDDVEHMLGACNDETQSNAIVIGGGLLGLEVAYGLKKQGMNVSVLHREDVLMNNQLDEVASEHLIQCLNQKGIDIITEANTKRFHGEDKVTAVELEDGTILEADVVVIAVGIRPNIELAKNIGLECDKAIVVNEKLQTSDESIFSLGECVQFKNTLYGLVAPLYEQAAICAKYLSGEETASYEDGVSATGLKVTGVNIFSAGQFQEDENCKVIKINDAKQNVYRKLVIKDNQLVGTLLYGDTTASNWYQDLIQSKQDVLKLKDYLMFGPAYFDDETLETVAV